MPPNQHLEWTKVDQFGGLWDAEGSMPPNGAQIMSGCHPQPGGGLRAFFAPLEWANQTGLDDSLNPVAVVGLFPSHSNWTILLADVDTTMAARAEAPRPAITDVQTYGGGFPFWSTGASPFDGEDWLSDWPASAASAGIVAVSDPSADDPGSDWYVTLEELIVSWNGLYKAFGGVMTQQDVALSFEPRVVASHQDRLVFGYGSSIVFTSPGVYDIPTSPTQPNQFINFGEEVVQWMVSNQPGDLLVGTRSGGVYQIQGPLDDPSVRVVVPKHTGEFSTGRATTTPIGTIAMAPTGPVIITQNQVVPAAPGLDRKHWAVQYDSNVSRYYGTPVDILPGEFAQANGFVFAPSYGLLANKTRGYDDGLYDDDPDEIDSFVEENRLSLNGSLVFDPSARAWFRSIHPDVAPCLAPRIHAESKDTLSNIRGVVTIPSEEFTGVAASLKGTRLGYRETCAGKRQHTWEWRSAPFHGGDGREVELREIQVGARGFGPVATGELSTATQAIMETQFDLEDSASGAVLGGTLCFTVRNEHGEEFIEVVDVEPGAQVLTAPVRLSGTYIDVTVKSASAHPDIEAPSLEYLSLGWTKGSRIYQK